MKLLYGDCIELLDSMSDGLVDMVLTDPPYSSGGLFAGNRKGKTSGKYTDRAYDGAARFPDFSGDNMDQRSFTEFMRKVLAKCRKKTKPEGVCAVFTDWRQLPAMTDALQMAGWVYRGIVVWNKSNARNIPNRFRQDCEFIIWGTNGSKAVDWTPGFKAFPGFYTESCVPSRQKHHQTEKPIRLLEKLLAISPENGVVLDCFMGSGSTGVACVNTGRNFIGMELLIDYFKIAEERIEKAQRKIAE